MNQIPVPYVPALPHPWKPFVPANPGEHRIKMRSQLARIVEACRGSGRPTLNALPSEVSEEVALAKVHNDDQDILDVDTEVRVISPQLAAVIKPTGRAHRMHEDGRLTVAERKEAAQALAASRKERSKWWIALPMPANPFSDLLST